MLVGGMLLIMTTLEKDDDDVEDALLLLILFMLLPLPFPLHVRLCVPSSPPLAVGISIGLKELCGGN